MSSYANVTCEPSRKALNFRTLFTPRGNEIDVVVPVESIRAINERFANTAYGFFLEKRVAYPVAVNYVKNTLGKYGMVKSMYISSTGLFSFQFIYMDGHGLNAMLENGPWFIRNHPLILKKWNPKVNLLKENVGTVSVWIKLHGVLVMAFSGHGLSVIVTKLGTPLMPDSYTSYMCLQSWGRSSYARVMIELLADLELKDTIMVVMPKLSGEGVVKNLKKPSHASRGIPRNKKKGVEPTKEDSNSNPFDVLNSVDNVGVLGTNGETSNLASNRANSSGSSFLNIETSSTSTTLLDSYENDDYDEDPYDDDMYECQDLPDKIQDICDNLDIRV
ncbi:beta-caryophyllene synthase [Tanacetum coccineum]